ncbi:MAG: hypothetical protein OXI66_02045, partial [Boseongicola sp.]|nr:hypothetical protein [Boseongicola sp.]
VHGDAVAFGIRASDTHRETAATRDHGSVSSRLLPRFARGSALGKLVLAWSSVAMKAFRTVSG